MVQRRLLNYPLSMLYAANNVGTKTKQTVMLKRKNRDIKLAKHVATSISYYRSLSKIYENKEGSKSMETSHDQKSMETSKDQNR